jgi:hypothetical protein
LRLAFLAAPYDYSESVAELAAHRWEEPAASKTDFTRSDETALAVVRPSPELVPTA